MRIILSVFFLLTFKLCYGNNLVEPADAQNEKHAKSACSKLGLLCAEYKKECTPPSSSMPNTCLAIRYFQLEVSKERCGKNKYLECDKTNIEYSKRWMHELNLPNMSNPNRMIAFEKCENIGMYKPKNKQLENYSDEVYQAFKHIREPIEDLSSPYYRIYKEYYQCFKDNL